VDVVYLDFAKAFDKVPHQRLARVLEAHGIGGCVLKWINEWLSNREQRVVLDGQYSKWEKVSSGVPQGSVLGPPLFVVYINPLDIYIKITAPIKSKFADDSKAGRAIKNADDHEQLQTAINQLVKWAEEWQMCFNTGKCSIMHFGHNNPRYSYTMDGQILKVSDTEKDVGVTITSSLKPSNHVNKAASKANQVLGLMSRSVHFRDRITWISLYKTYVRPHMEYAVQTWSPWAQKDIQTLEKVQERAVNMCSGLKGSNYTEKLVEVGLTTLADRRVRADMIQVWKIIHGKDRVDEKVWFERLEITSTRETRATASGLNLAIPRTNLEIRRNFFSARVPIPWNNIPTDIKMATSLESFKRQYDEWIIQRHS
jgi:hypothetical protein